MSQIFTSSFSSPPPPSVPTSFVTDSGIAVPVANILNVLGGIGTDTSGIGNTITISTDSSLPYTEISAIDSPYTVLLTDTFISCDTTGGAVTVLLPDSTNDGREIIIKDRLGNAISKNISVTTVSGLVTIDGNTSYILSDNFESVDLMFGSSVYQTF